MTCIVPFTAQKDLKAAQQLDAFIDWAKTTLPKGVPDRVHEGVLWEVDSWHHWGIRACKFSRLGAQKHDKVFMQPPFLDFAKGVIVYRRIWQGKKSVSGWLYALKALEVALVEITGQLDVTQLNAAICNKAIEHIKVHLSVGNSAYRIGKVLENIVDVMKEKRLLAAPFRWISPLSQKHRGTLKQQKLDRQSKLPSRESIRALGEIFNNELTIPLDIITTAACAILLSQPSRIGELADVPLDCVVYKEDGDGGQRMFLRWYSEKGFGATLKPVVAGMEPAIERVLNLVTPLTDEPRAYAAWLEDHPDEFPPHPGVPMKGHDDPLSYAEVCAALMIAVPKSFSHRYKFKKDFLDKLAKQKALSLKAQTVLDDILSGWDVSQGQRVYVDDRLNHYVFNDTCVITLRMLNVLMREKYLPKNFPYTTPFEEGKSRIKYRDALFTVRTGSLVKGTKSDTGKPRSLGVELGASVSRLNNQLAGLAKMPSIFERHGYPGVRVNSHAFRHELNTEMHRAGLSQLLIDAFSGRTSMGSVYNHETVEERIQALIEVHPSTKKANSLQRLEKLKTNAPLSLSDVTDLDENAQDRIIHKTHFGICVHDFSYTPCPKMGACLTCGKLACVKGDEVKLANLKDERNALKVGYDKSVDAEARGVLGASEWRKKAAFDLLKCNALIQTLENPDIENGSIVWNSDNGWNLTNNAAAMAGLRDPKEIEAQVQETTPSLEDLAALMAQLEE